MFRYGKCGSERDTKKEAPAGFISGFPQQEAGSGSGFDGSGSGGDGGNIASCAGCDSGGDGGSIASAGSACGSGGDRASIGWSGQHSRRAEDSTVP